MKKKLPWGTKGIRNWRLQDILIDWWKVCQTRVTYFLIIWCIQCLIHEPQNAEYHLMKSSGRFFAAHWGKQTPGISCNQYIRINLLQFEDKDVVNWFYIPISTKQSKIKDIHSPKRASNINPLWSSLPNNFHNKLAPTYEASWQGKYNL